MNIIAEFCQNHNGDFELLKEMVYAAKENGADYAKIQTIFADMVSYRERFENGHLENGRVKVIKRPYQSEYDRLKGLEITLDQQAEFVELCNKLNIKPLTTVFTRDSIAAIKEIGFEEVKLASYDCASPALIKDVKDDFKKVFLSTGATFDHEIEEAATILGDANYCFFHCVTIYPTPLKDFNLKRMDYLRQFTPCVGWSDHSLTEKDGVLGTLAAIYQGANAIERHFTLLPSNETKDGPVSITTEELSQIRSFSKLSRQEMKSYLLDVFPNFEITHGDSKRELSETELLNRDYFRGRFANKLTSGKFAYNWEDIKL